MIDLYKIESPDFLKTMSIKELKLLADEIRRFIIEKVSVTGGHLSSNLGVVELSIALHYSFNSPYDKFIFDVGHQTYTHKILTGRAKDFDNLRKLNGLSGFPKYNESIHDVFETGHSSTSIAAAAGFLEARSQGVDIGEVIAIIGDGSVQNGLALSGLNYLGSKKNQKVIIILNDNEMSISKNVGALATVLNKVRVNKSYKRLKRITPKFVKIVGTHLLKGPLSIYAYRKYFALYELGYKYIGPIDGNDISELIKYLNYAKDCSQSVIIHIKTKKGKGYPYSENDMSGTWHGVGPFEIETGKQIQQIGLNQLSWSQAIGNIVYEEMKKNDKIIAICPAMIKGSELGIIEQNFPKRIIDVGICEELSVVMASSMSLSGLIPIDFIYSSFIQRAYDEISHDIARTNRHVIFMIDRAGIIPNDGDTHQGIFDISFLSHLPNMTIVCPRNYQESKALLAYCLYKIDGPVAFRYPKSLVLKDNGEIIDIDNASWEIVNPISEKNIITYSSVVDDVLDKIGGLQIGLINARFIKPIDCEVLKKLVNKQVYVYEEVERIGSLGSLILDECNRLNINIELHLVSVDEIYVEHGSTSDLKKKYHLDIESLINRIKG